MDAIHHAQSLLVVRAAVVVNYVEVSNFTHESLEIWPRNLFSVNSQRLYEVG